MRPSADQVKAAILDSDRDIRNAAIRYFSRSFSPDPRLVPLVIEAVEKYGWDAFTHYYFLRELKQSSATVDWLIRRVQLVKVPRSDPDFDDDDAFVEALTHADPLLLREHEARIRELKTLAPHEQEAIEQRVQFVSLPSEELWRKLEQLCESLPEDEPEDPGEDSISTADLTFANRIIEALSRHREQFAERVLIILLGEEDDADRWMEIFAVRMAGEMRLSAAIPRLVDYLHDDREFLPEDSERALIKLGSDEVVNELLRNYSSGDRYFQLSVADILANVATDLAVQNLHDLLKLELEEDSEVEGALIQALLVSFDPLGIELGREFILNMPDEPQVFDVRAALLTACKMTGERIPEYDDWLAEIEAEDTFSQSWSARRPPEEFDDETDSDDAGEFDEHSGLYIEDLDNPHDVYRPTEPPITIVREEARVGRNDPCPCGSGKKFKKCCYGKERPQSDTDMLRF